MIIITEAMENVFRLNRTIQKRQSKTIEGVKGEVLFRI